MLCSADDYLIHQTPEPLRFVGTSDRRFFDRYFFAGLSHNSELAFILGMGLYPNLGVIDGFGTFSHGSTQLSVRGSRELGVDRMDTKHVGPFSITVLEGLRKFALTCQETDGLAFDLTWTATLPVFEEPAYVHRFGARIVEQNTRLIQSGVWDGSISIGADTYAVSGDTWWGGRDHSWGFRPHGLEPEPPGLFEAHLAKRETGIWIWAPLQFRDHSLHFNVLEQTDGTRSVSTVRRMREGSVEVELLSGAEHHLNFDPISRRLIGGFVSWLDQGGVRRVVTLKPLRSCYLFAGTGYGGPDPWRHGQYMGPNWRSSVSYDLADADVLRKIGMVEHSMCRMELDNGDVGFGTFEVMFGPKSRYGQLL